MAGWQSSGVLRRVARCALVPALAVPLATVPVLVLGAAVATASPPAQTAGADEDGDGIPDSIEGDRDSDDDGLPDRIDRNSDNDALPDAVEGTLDRDNDGVPDYRDADETTSEATATPVGDGYRIEAAGFGAGAPVTAYAHPGRDILGRDMSDGEGDVDLVVTPSDDTPRITVEGYGLDGGPHVASVSLVEEPDVTTGSDGPTDGDTDGGTDSDDSARNDDRAPSELAMTGPSAVMIEAAVGAVLVIGGAALQLVARRLSRAGPRAGRCGRRRPGHAGHHGSHQHPAAPSHTGRLLVGRAHAASDPMGTRHGRGGAVAAGGVHRRRRHPGGPGPPGAGGRARAPAGRPGVDLHHRSHRQRRRSRRADRRSAGGSG